MLILGVESSCDETGIALYDSTAGLLAHALHSQVAMHAEYGGVVPELASRDHIRRVVPLLRSTLENAGKSLDDIDAIAYTRGPGLSGALLVGCAFAEALAVALDKPTLPVHPYLALTRETAPRGGQLARHLRPLAPEIPVPPPESSLLAHRPSVPRVEPHWP